MTPARAQHLLGAKQTLAVGFVDIETTGFKCLAPVLDENDAVIDFACYFYHLDLDSGQLLACAPTDVGTTIVSAQYSSFVHTTRVHERAIQETLHVSPACEHQRIIESSCESGRIQTVQPTETQAFWCQSLGPR
eukprot:m.344165 g.344165  ORF g.344165 m.344165 type:complete len:134 (+) comp16134_c0_seq4:2573-2974(+)